LNSLIDPDSRNNCKLGLKVVPAAKAGWEPPELRMSNPIGGDTGQSLDGSLAAA
jgi:hypothetical protein